MTSPSFPDLKPVGSEDGPLIRDFLARFPSEACEMTFANIYHLAGARETEVRHP